MSDPDEGDGNGAEEEVPFSFGGADEEEKPRTDEEDLDAIADAALAEAELAAKPAVVAPKKSRLKAVDMGAARAGLAWEEELARSPRDGQLRATPQNLMTIMTRHEALKSTLCFDEFANCTRWACGAPWDETPRSRLLAENDLIALAIWCEKQKYPAFPRDMIRSVYPFAASKNGNVHPVKEYLDALQWDGQKTTTWACHTRTIQSPQGDIFW
jgi:hypothetical protein